MRVVYDQLFEEQISYVHSPLGVVDLARDTTTSMANTRQQINMSTFMCILEGNNTCCWSIYYTFNIRIPFHEVDNFVGNLTAS